ncbi:hypothetical protein CAC42_976 [Sphaceloma murrayae]|uniref:Uncharacterized protein n=1 Tax=Sphaceloma murrayae TaxID=2082308 RepID=A0A2K1R2U8_9PEZI|nr:hypothetical protein CAC42_976 [Sphaceloma murrayae]
MKLTLLPLLAVAGTAVAVPAGQPQASPPGLVDPTILKRAAAKNATGVAKNGTVKAEPYFQIKSLHYTLDPADKKEKAFQSNLTFGLVMHTPGAATGKNGTASFVTCDDSWSVRGKNKKYKSKAFVSCGKSGYAFKVTESKPYGENKIELRYRQAKNATAYTEFLGKIAFKDSDKAQPKVECMASKVKGEKIRKCVQSAGNGTVAWTAKASKKQAGKKASKKEKSLVERMMELL